MANSTNVRKTESKEVIYENSVEFKGTIVNKFKTDKVIILTISTGKADKIPNYPKITFFNNREEIDSKFKKHDNVTIQANVQSSKRTILGREVITQSIIGEHVTESPSALETTFGIKVDTIVSAYENRVKLAGVVTEISTPARNLIRVKIHTMKNGRHSNILATYYTRDVGELLEKVRVRDNIVAIGNVQTPKKEKNGETVHYENIVIEELEKVS